MEKERRRRRKWKGRGGGWRMEVDGKRGGRIEGEGWKNRERGGGLLKGGEEKGGRVAEKVVEEVKRRR